MATLDYGPLNLSHYYGSGPIACVMIISTNTSANKGNLIMKISISALFKKTCNFYGQIPATLMPVVDRNNYG